VSDQAPRAFTTEFKERAVLRLQAGEPFSALATELGVRRKLLYEWSKAYRLSGVGGLNRKRGPKTGSTRTVVADVTAPRTPSDQAGNDLAQARARIAELERVVGRQQVDLDFFRRALRLIDEVPPIGIAPTSARSLKP